MIRCLFTVVIVALCIWGSNGVLEEASNTLGYSVLKEDDIQLSGDVLHQELKRNKASGPCILDNDCRNGARCVEDFDSSSSCLCKNGTSGVFCEIVDACQDTFTCTGNDVTCEYDKVNEKPYCKCKDTSKSYDPDWEKCRVPCNSFEDCGRYGYCYYSSAVPSDNTQFCSCEMGASGDFCDIIDQCERGKVKCFDDPNITCSLGRFGNAFCNCLKYGYGYDYDSNTCKQCSCETSTSCEWRSGKKNCLCSGHNYYWDGYKCQECPCGWGYSCKLSEKGNIVCDCPKGTVQRDNACANCDCGENSYNCSFKGREKVCACKPGFVVGEYNQCRKACSATQPCQNSGTCDKTCRCSRGTRGDLCEIVEWCLYNRCGDLAECVYDPEIPYSFATCRCKLPKYIYNSYKENCLECDCGAHGNCSLNYFGSKSCACDDGYQPNYNYYKCEECECGPNSNCFFHYDGLKRCSCNSGYKFLTKGIEKICTRCDCGPNYFDCHFDDLGRQTCSCHYDFISFKGTCIRKEECNCKTVEDTTCSYGENGWEEKQCQCPKGYRFGREFCEDINECFEKTYSCPQNTDCVNTQGSYECHCKNGFEESRYGIEYYGCEDIDECRDRNACQYPSVKCVNTQGSYKCVCRRGLLPGTEYDSGVYETKDNWCYKPVSPYRLASKILGGIIGAIIGIQLIVIIYNRWISSKSTVSSGN